MSSNDMSQVRDYVKERILALYSTYQEWTGSLEDIGNIPQTILDRSFHIELGSIPTTTQTENWLEDNNSVLISIFKRGFNDPVVARDELLQIANCMRLEIINPLNVETYKRANDGNIENIQSISIIPSAIDDSDDNINKVELALNVRLFFATI